MRTARSTTAAPSKPWRRSSRMPTSRRSTSKPRSPTRTAIRGIPVSVRPQPWPTPCAPAASTCAYWPTTTAATAAPKASARRSARSTARASAARGSSPTAATCGGTTRCGSGPVRWRWRCSTTPTAPTESPCRTALS